MSGAQLASHCYDVCSCTIGTAVNVSADANTRRPSEGERQTPDDAFAVNCCHSVAEEVSSRDTTQLRAGGLGSGTLGRYTHRVAAWPAASPYSWRLLSKVCACDYSRCEACTTTGRHLQRPSDEPELTCNRRTRMHRIAAAIKSHSARHQQTPAMPLHHRNTQPGRSLHRQQLTELAAALRAAAGLGSLRAPPQWRAHVPGTSRRSCSLNVSVTSGRRSSAADSSTTVLAGISEGRSASDRTPALLPAANAATIAATSSGAEPALRPAVYHISAVVGPALPAPAAPTAAPARGLNTAETTSQGSQATLGHSGSNFRCSRLRSAALWPAAVLRRCAGGRQGWSAGIGDRLLKCTRCCRGSEAQAAAPPPPPPHTRAPQVQQPLPDAAAAAQWLEALARQARQSSTSDDGDKLAAETPGCGLLACKKRRPASRLPHDIPSTVLAKSLLENFMCPITHVR